MQGDWINYNILRKVQTILFEYQGSDKEVLLVDKLLINLYPNLFKND